MVSDPQNGTGPGRSPKPISPVCLDETLMARGLAELKARDAHLARVTERFGPPPMWAREPGFATLVHIILEQQVSLASARAAFDRLGEALGTVTPEAFLALTDEHLKTIGFSRQKTRYCRILAESVLAGGLRTEALHTLDDQTVTARLTALTGIGPWTAQIYLLMVLRRPDIWPRGDIALATAYGELTGGPRPRDAALAEVADRWRPWRAVAARVLWHFYLSTPRRRR